MKTNILLLSAGRRVELLRGLVSAADSLPEVQVYCADMRPTLSAACQLSTKAFRVPSASDASYVEMLSELCQTNRIGVVIPTIDTELTVLATCRERFASKETSVLVCDLSLINDCRDKRRTEKLFAKLGLSTPRIYSLRDIVFPCFTKLYDGSSSVGVMRLESQSDLTETMLAEPTRIYQELIRPDYRELTVDLYYDRYSALKAIVPRERLEVRAGEVSKGVTRRDWLYGYLLERLSELRGARGCVTLQLFAGRDNRDVQAIEINPRFGGGFPLTLAAGANFPQWIIDEYILGKDIDFFDAWEPDLLMLRYDAKVLSHGYI